MGKKVPYTSFNNLQNAFSRFHILHNTGTDLQELFSAISGDTFANLFKNIFTKSRDAINSLRAYPIKHSKLVELEGLSTEQSTLEMMNTSFNIHNYQFSVTSYRHTVGFYRFPSAESFIDLAPHTKISLYLPYLDFVDLPVNEVVGNAIYVYYVIDYSSGMATAYIQSQTNGHVIAIKSGKIGIDIPWGATNNVENVRNIINTALSTGIQVATLGLTSGASEIAKVGKSVAMGSTLAKGSLSIANSLQQQITRGGNSGGASILCSPSAPYLIIRKPKLVSVDEDDYAHTYGKPLYESRTLEDMRGFTVVDEIHLTGLPNALDEEVNEIENLLKSGVHL